MIQGHIAILYIYVQTDFLQESQMWPQVHLASIFSFNGDQSWNGLILSLSHNKVNTLQHSSPTSLSVKSTIVI